MNTHSRELLAALKAVGVDARAMPLRSPWGLKMGGWVIPWLQRLLEPYPPHEDGIIHHVNADAWRGADVMTVHDLAPWKMNGRGLQRFAYIFAIRRVKKVVVTTLTTKVELEARVPIARGKVHVVPVPFHPAPATRYPQVYDAMWVGGNSPNKRAMEFIKLASMHPRYKFVMVWSKGTYRPKLNAEIERAAAVVPNLFSIHREVTDSELDALYRSSKVYVSTSLYEGWHAPVTEAYLRGCRVVIPDMPPYSDIYPFDAEGVYWYYAPSSDVSGTSMRAALIRAIEGESFEPDARVVRDTSYANVGALLKQVYEI